MQHSDPLMIELIPAINEIVKYGLQPGLTIADREKMLDKISLKFTPRILKLIIILTKRTIRTLIVSQRGRCVLVTEDLKHCTQVRQGLRHCCEVGIDHFGIMEHFMA